MRVLAFSLCLLAAACRSPLQPEGADADAERRAYVGAGLSALPQVGVGVVGGWRVSARESQEIYLEAEGVAQFLNDADFNNDGFGGPGTYYQVGFGLMHSFTPKSRRHLTLRYGAAWLHTTSGQTILDQPGTYLGGYLGIGFDTDLSERWSMGPEVRVLGVWGTASQGFEILPQFAWRFVFKF